MTLNEDRKIHDTALYFAYTGLHNLLKIDICPSGLINEFSAENYKIRVVLKLSSILYIHITIIYFTLINKVYYKVEAKRLI